MQTARVQKEHNHTGGGRAGRNRMLAAINITWRNLRPDLHHSEEELRDERLAFITDALRLKRPLNSTRDLTERQLGTALDAMRRLESQPMLPHGAAAPAAQNGGAEIVHLATAEQVHVINKLLDHLGWSERAREEFIKRRFRRSGPSMLSPQQANSLVMILLNIAAARAVKDRGGAARVSRRMIAMEIPALKERLGIDRSTGGKESRPCTGSKI